MLKNSNRCRCGLDKLKIKIVKKGLDESIPLCLYGACSIKHMVTTMIVKEGEIKKYLGDYIGGGCSRSVFTHNVNPSLIIKEAKFHGFGNLREYKYFWNCKVEISELLCPVHAISENWKYLVMPKCKTIKSCIDDFDYDEICGGLASKLKSLKSNLWDVEFHNIGFYQGKCVLFDYESIREEGMEEIFGGEWRKYC